MGCYAGEIPEDPIAENYHMYRQNAAGVLNAGELWKWEY